MASCIFKWLWYAPDCGLKGKVGEDGNVTEQLVTYKRHWRELKNYFKSVHNTNALVESTFHTAECEGCLLPGFKTVEVPAHVAYVAHNRRSYMTEKQKKKYC